jgi:hypothetical protein
MCENMAVSEVCAIFEVLCSVPDVQYTESGNSSISDEDKGRSRLLFIEIGDARLLSQ